MSDAAESDDGPAGSDVPPPEDDDQAVDVLRFGSGDGATYRLATAGKGDEVVQAHTEEADIREWLRTTLGIVAVVASIGGGVILDAAVEGVVLAVLLGVVFWLAQLRADPDEFDPDVVAEDIPRWRAHEQYDIEREGPEITGDLDEEAE
jgi:hypothetical protein